MHKILPAALPLLASSLFAQGTPEVEPNDTILTGTALAAGDQADGVIGVAGDFDHFAITLSASADVRLWVNPGTGATPLNDSDLTLFDAGGATLAFNDDVSGVTNWLSRVIVGNLPAGTYSARVRSSQTFSPNALGTYTLDVIAAPPGTYIGIGGVPTPVAEGPEDNDPRNVGGVATASFQDSINSGNISTGTATAAYVSAGADYDFYQVSVTASGMLTIETVAGAAAPAMTDTVVFFADSALTLVNSDDNGGAGMFSLLVVPVTPGTYHVAVKGWDSGNYVLNVNLVPAVPTGSASVTVNPGGCGPTLGTRSTTAGPVVATEVPVLGSDFYVDGGNMAPGSLLMRVIGLVQLVPPFDLGPLGAPGCQIEVNPLDQIFAIADGAGIDYWVVSSPVLPAFIGLPIEQQLAVVDLPANALGITASNTVSSVFGIEN